ncbi:hypothetical protein HG66A1_37330 [Gimesia chilikensis]|jgi:hypothetical protein|uniref:Uncharacterized protein n=1 Tax=Gimesia chilikensis TaxID=2605989 RepID=A0A517PRC3_9PLAN|nr:hypothetical protein HG66A1_37330 [Gimesia chilikensis]
MGRPLRPFCLLELSTGAKDLRLFLLLRWEVEMLFETVTGVMPLRSVEATA